MIFIKFCASTFNITLVWLMKWNGLKCCCWKGGDNIQREGQSLKMKDKYLSTLFWNLTLHSKWMHAS
jgi:hypothetical protein